MRCIDPVLTGPDFPGGRHKDPTSGLLCFYNIPEGWNPSISLADELIRCIEVIIKAHADPENAGDIEADEATQFTGHLTYCNESVTILGDWEIPKGIEGGKFTYVLENPVQPPGGPFRGVVHEIQDHEGNSLGSLSDKLKKKYPGGKKFVGFWARITALPSTYEVERFLSCAATANPKIGTERFKGAPIVNLVLCPEEVTRGDNESESWVSIVRQKVPDLDVRQNRQLAYFSRAEPIDRRIFQARVNNLSSLSKRRIAVFGVGALGSNIAWQLARAGVGALELVDHDVLQYGNLPRWIRGMTYIGVRKALALQNSILSDYPEVSTDAHIIRIGAADVPEDQVRSLEDIIQRSDLVIDAAADFNVSNYLSNRARLLSKNYIWCTSTNGGWGGVVGCIYPERTEGCWSCFQAGMQNEDIPIPPQSSAEFVQVRGCFHPAFTGTGFDLDTISNTCVRAAVAGLTSDDPNGYSPFSWDIAICRAWDKDAGCPILPEWTTMQLARHRNCPRHAY